MSCDDGDGNNGNRCSTSASVSSAVVSIMTKLDDKSMIFINFDVYKVHQILSLIHISEPTRPY